MGTGGGFGRRQGQEPVLVFYGKDCMKNTPFTHSEAMASVTHSCLSGIPEKWTLGRERGACVSNLGKLKILICFFFSLYLKIYYYLTICFLVIYFKYSSVYVSIPNSRSIAPPDSYTLVTTSSFSSSDLAPQGSLRLVWTAVIVDFCDRGRSSSSRGREVMG